METKQLSKSEKIKKDITEISKEIKNQLREEYPDCKWSVRTERYAGGRSLEVILLKAPFRVFKEWEEVSEDIKFDIEQNIIQRNLKKELENITHADLNNYHLDEENKQRITEKAYKVFKKVREIVEQYRYDESRPQEDYFNTNFYYSLKIGRYNQPFKQEG